MHLMNTKDSDYSQVSIGGFPFAEASVGIWVTSRNGDSFVPVPAVAYAGDLLFSAAERALRRIFAAVAEVVNKALEESASQEDLAEQLTTMVGVGTQAPVSKGKAA